MADHDRYGSPAIPTSVFWLLALWVVVVLVALVWGVDNAETDLRQRALDHLAADGHDVAIDISGRDARLIGTVTQEEIASAIVDSVDSIPGIRRVNDEIVVDEPEAAPLRMPDVSMRLIGDVVSIRGLVPDEIAAGNILVAASVQFGEENIINALVVADDVESMTWLSRLEDVFAPLAGLRSGGFTADAGGIRVAGEVLSETAGLELIEGLELVLADQLPLTTELSIAVLPSPTFSAAGTGDTLVFEGVLPSDEVVAGVNTAAERLFPNAVVVDVLRVGDVAGPAWLDTLEGVLDVAARLDPWTVEIVDGTLRVAGTGADQDVVAALQVLLEGVVGGELRIEVDVEVAPAAVAAQLTSLFEGIATFEPNGTTLSADGIARLDLAIGILEASPSTVLVVEGHTDSQGDTTSNLALSQQRAEAVVAYLVDGGIGADRLSAVGYGEGRPIADNATPEGRAQNRRIEFVIREGDG